MVEVQELELVLGARQVDFEGVWARRAVEAADATEGGHTESVNKRRLVVPVSMADKGRPRCLAEARRRRMYLARRDVGALTRALQRCLPRRTPTLLKVDCEALACGFVELGFG